MNTKKTLSLREEIEALALRLRFVRDLNVEALDLQNMQQELDRILARHPAEPAMQSDAATPPEPDAFNAADNADHYGEALEYCLDARAAIVEALSRAIGPQAHYRLSSAVATQTSVLQLIEQARKDDAS